MSSPNVSVWTTKSGEKIRVCDLTDDHLTNILNHIIRRHDALCFQSLSILEQMDDETGGADEAFGEFMDDPSVSTPLFRELSDEYHRRGLGEFVQGHLLPKALDYYRRQADRRDELTRDPDSASRE